MYEVLACGPAALEQTLQSLSNETGAKVWKLGQVTKGDLVIDKTSKKLNELHEQYRSGWRKHFPQLA
jgi:hypothetical protein